MHWRADQPDVALPILAHSPLLLEDDLVDLIATGETDAQVAIAGRRFLTRGLAAAIAEVGAAEACLTLLENPERRRGAVFAGPHHRALRPPGADPRESSGARRFADSNAPGAAREIVPDACRFCRRAPLVGAGARRVHGKGCMRKSNRGPCCGHALRRSGHPGAAFASDGTTHGRHAFACAAVRQRCAVSKRRWPNCPAYRSTA